MPQVSIRPCEDFQMCPNLYTPRCSKQLGSMLSPSAMHPPNSGSNLCANLSYLIEAAAAITIDVEVYLKKKISWCLAQPKTAAAKWEVEIGAWTQTSADKRSLTPVDAACEALRARLKFPARCSCTMDPVDMGFPSRIGIRSSIGRLVFAGMMATEALLQQTAPL